MAKGAIKKALPDSALQGFVTTVEEQGILESFSKLPNAERAIIRQLLEKFSPREDAVIRLPVPSDPKKVKERRYFLLPVYRLIRYHRLIFDTIAEGSLLDLLAVDRINHPHQGRGRRGNRDPTQWQL